MPQLRELLQQHLQRHSASARAFAERVGISYPTVLALLHKGSVPRKPEHRELLRQELGLAQDEWASVLAASQRDGIDIPREGPLTLRQLVLKALLAQGYTEQTFARASGIPYATIMGVTRKGAIPRADTLLSIAEKLALEPSQVEDAAERSRAERAVEGFEPSGEVVLVPPPSALSTNGHAFVEEGEEQPPAEAEPPQLAQLVADRVASQQLSLAAFARQHGLPYLSLHRLVATGEPPQQPEALQALRAAVGLDTEHFARSLERSQREPTPAQAPSEDQHLTPLQEALQALVKARHLTTKAFAELADLSVLTATKLLKHGDLPGRTSTHEKLRTLLQLAPADYEDLVARSRSDQADRGGATADGPTLEELMQLVRALGVRQRHQLKQFLVQLGTSSD